MVIQWVFTFPPPVQGQLIPLFIWKCHEANPSVTFTICLEYFSAPGKNDSAISLKPVFEVHLLPLLKYNFDLHYFNSMLPYDFTFSYDILVFNSECLVFLSSTSAITFYP